MPSNPLFYILGIQPGISTPHLLCRDTVTDPENGFVEGEEDFISGFDGTLPDGPDSGAEAVRFNSIEAAEDYIKKAQEEGSDWIYALWNPCPKASMGAFPPSKPWTTTAPESTGLYWWQASDETLPINVAVDYCPNDESYFAAVGQHGWTDPQAVTEMGGVWMHCPEPEPFDFSTLFPA